MKDLADIRERIDRIDHEISRLFMERMEVSADVAEFKRGTGKPIYDPARERENIIAATRRVPAEYANYAAVLQSVLMEASRDVQHRALDQKSPAAQDVATALASTPAAFPSEAKVACQGVWGAHQQIATDLMFKRADIDFCDTFEEVFEAVESGVAEYGVLPIENSTVGSVNLVYDLIMRHDCHIARSCRLRIEHDLLVRPGTRIEDIRCVYSHEQALSQCSGYISRIPNCRAQACSNTAKAAEKVARSGRNDVAAIASKPCADIYGLTIADHAIQDSQSNYTRFVCITKDLVIYPGANRSSLMLVADRRPGSLYGVLSRFHALGINLHKIESRPIPSRDFEFMFFFDVDCLAAAPEFQALMDSLCDACSEFRLLGSYLEVM